MRSGKELIRILCKKAGLDGPTTQEFEQVFAQLDAARAWVDGNGDPRVRKVTAAGGDVILDNEGISLQSTTGNSNLTYFSGDTEVGSAYHDGEDLLIINEVVGERISLQIAGDTGSGYAYLYEEAEVTKFGVSSGSLDGATLSVGLSNTVEIRTVEGSHSAIQIDESSATPTHGLTAGVDVDIYKKADKFVIRSRDAGGTYRYFWLDLTTTSDQSWIYSASAP